MLSSRPLRPCPRLCPHGATGGFCLKLSTHGLSRLARALRSWLLSLTLIFIAGPAWAFPTTAFLARYWHRPLELGGDRKPPWPPFETSLSAKACGQCHVAQYRAWRQSRHAAAMGPGVIGQLAVAGPSHWAFVRGCLSCHAPGRRQWAAVRTFIAQGQLKGLARQGVTCADCHVRHYQRFGPALLPYLAAGRVVHDGFTPRAAFTRSRFCISCHQFHRDGARLDGVLLENTYYEWRASRFAAMHITCQSCHMPHGRHSFAGIHNPRFVRRALTIHLTLRNPHRQSIVRAALSVTNSGVGHDFPTYTTPEIIIGLTQVCGAGACPDSRRQLIIGRRISLNLRHQYFDTRIKPGATRTLRYVVPKAVGATAFSAQIVVYPDAAYVRFFRAYLAAYTLTPAEHTQIEQALKRDERSRYVLWHRQIALKVSRYGSPLANGKSLDRGFRGG